MIVTAIVKMNNVCFEIQFHHILNESLGAYFQHSSRSSKKVNILHEFIRTYLNKNLTSQFECKTEVNVSCLNASGRKRIDIGIFEGPVLRVIIPTKFICRNYKQNKNNYLENLIGECTLLKISNPGVRIFPLNIFIRNCRYHDKNGDVRKMEYITHTDTDIYHHSSIMAYDKCFNVMIDCDYERKRIKRLDCQPFLTAIVLYLNSDNSFNGLKRSNK